MNNNSYSIFFSVFFPLSTLLADIVLLDPPFEFHYESVTIDISSDSVGSFNGMIHNTSSDVVNLAVVRRLNDFEENWTSSICVGAICYNEMIDSVSVEISAGDSIPCGVLAWANGSGEGTIQLDIFDLNGQSEHVLVDIIFYFNETVSTITDDGLQEGFKSFNLMDNYPNPFNPVTSIPYFLDENNFIHLSIHDLSGKLVKTLFEGKQNAGHHSINCNSRNKYGESVAAGIYFYNFSLGNIIESKKMILLK